MGFVEFCELCRYAQNYGVIFVFYDKFLELCQKKGVKPSPAAEEAGISKSLVTKWKTQRIETPSADILNKLSKYFNVPVSELLGEDAIKEKSPGQPELTERESKILDALRSKSEAEQIAFLTLLGVLED